jgi:acyl-CoA reductase-like NAD-dependent aldehyde dehydrogenase
MGDMQLSKKQFGVFVGGNWIDTGENVEIRSPFDQSVVANVRRATRAHLDEAISAAVAAFEVTRKMASYERKRVLDRVAAELSSRKEEFANAICLEAGKPIKTARAEVDRAIFTMQIAAEESMRIGGEVLPLDLQEFTAGRWSMVRRFPVGPLAAITPFNFPLNLVCHKLGPALAAGCPVVLKPAPQTPVSSLMLADAIDRAGWPKGALSVVYLSNDDASVLVEDDRLKMLSFTGSAAVGWQLKARSGKKKVVLELGGNAGCIVHDDADIEQTASRCAVGGFSYAGQSCISVQRIFVHENVYDQFIAALITKVKALKVGDPSEESTDVGPLIRESDATRAESWIKEAVAEGAKLLCGGTRTGSMVDPAILTDTRESQKVNCMELFAPVVTVEKYRDFEEALKMVNNSTFGLQAGVFTRDAVRIFRAYEVLEVGGVIVGDVPTFRIDHMPYGGVKDSGLGREGVKYAIEEMTELKLMVVALGK